MNITVYLGSSFGDDPSYQDQVRKLGQWIGRNGHTLVFGGNGRGLMGILAEAVKQSGGKVIGVEPSFLMAWGTPSPVLDELIEVSDMNERKKKMMDLADHFIACPGGIGTLDEITDIIVQKELGQLFGKAVLFNVNGFYEPLRALLAEMQQHGFIRSTLQDNVFYANSVEDIAALLEE